MQSESCNRTVAPPVRFPASVAHTERGVAVLWIEAGQPYAVSGRRSLQEILEIAEGLEQLDRATWERRLRPE